MKPHDHALSQRYRYFHPTSGVAFQIWGACERCNLTYLQEKWHCRRLHRPTQVRQSLSRS